MIKAICGSCVHFTFDRKSKGFGRCNVETPPWVRSADKMQAVSAQDAQAEECPYFDDFEVIDNEDYSAYE